MVKATQPTPIPPAEEREAISDRLLRTLPDAMRDRQQWLLWREEVHPERGVIKVPYYVGGSKRFGELGGPEDRSRLAHLADAVAAYLDTGRFSGIGFAFLGDDGLIGIDLDSPIVEGTGEMQQHHRSIVEACASYTEWSPSGNGLHIICAGQTDSFKHDPIGVEVYCGGRYFTCTGRHFEGTPEQVRPIASYALDYLRMLVDRSKEQARQAKAATRAAAAPAAVESAAPTRPPRGEGGASGGDDFRRVNDEALRAVDAWVPALFPKATRRGYGWRVTSKALGRELEEDLQLAPEGVYDFGEETPMSPIDVVLKWGGARSPKDALHWLAARLGVQLSGPAKRPRAADPEPPAHVLEGPPPDDIPPEAQDTAPAEDGEASAVAALVPAKGGGRKRNTRVNTSTVELLLEKFALVYGTDQVWDGTKRALMQVKNLRLIFGAPVVNQWLAHPERRLLMPEQIKFEPGVELPEDCVNLFDGLPTEPVECEERDVKPMLDLLHHLCKVSARTAEGVEAVKDQVLKWCATIVQRPGAKMRFAIVFHGPQGTGKNMFCDALRKILGRYGKMVGQSELDDRFNGYMSGKLLLIGNEVVTRQELFHQKNKLKWVITEDEIPIRGMHQEVRWESNHANIIFLSNELMPVALEWDDRRHLVIYTPAAEDADLYLRVADFMDRDGLGKWMYWLQQVDLDDFNEWTKPLMTEAKEALMELGMKPAERFVMEWLGGLLPLPLRVCSAEQLFRVYMRWCQLNGERDFRGQAMFTRTAERFVRERVELDPETKRRRPPALTYKAIALKDDHGGRKTVRCWLPRGTGAPNGITEGEWAWDAVRSFERLANDYGRAADEGEAA
ncbi:DUF5906 domain-containing protein [Rubrivivax sp. JA1026]|uniref:DUF5906 domain-containing protein n=1 Tax=Rubrivivax sp. JA1026 TaxID=2710888 RepID=UPI0013E94D45|nr:DUF5906 domain-containing protein [Rubrivivax sp. JA1026]